MADNTQTLTLLLRSGEKPARLSVAPTLNPVADPGPVMRRVRTFFRPWRLLGKTLLVGVPFWITAAIITVGGAAAQWLAELVGSASTMAAAGMSTATTVALVPLGVLAVWAGFVALLDLGDLSRVRKASQDYQAAIGRANEPDVLTLADLRRPSVLQGLKALGHMDALMHSLARDGSPISTVVQDGLRQSHELVRRSVLDLIATERRLSEWSGKLGGDSSYLTKLATRRDTLLAAYPGILDHCLHATDHGLTRAGDDPGDLKTTVEQLLARCQHALNEVDQPALAVDEQELLMYAARARDERAALGESEQGRDPD